MYRALSAGLHCSDELAEDVLQDSAVLEVEDFLGRVDADFGFEGFGFAGCVGGADFEGLAVSEFGVEEGFEAGEVEGLFTGEAEALRAFACIELHGENAHAD